MFMNSMYFIFLYFLNILKVYKQANKQVNDICTVYYYIFLCILYIYIYYHYYLYRLIATQDSSQFHTRIWQLEDSQNLSPKQNPLATHCAQACAHGRVDTSGGQRLGRGPRAHSRTCGQGILRSQVPTCPFRTMNLFPTRKRTRTGHKVWCSEKDFS